jgi:hypothetical protein
VNYAYVSEDGVVIWEDRPISAEAPPVEIEREGVTFRRSYRAERAGVPATQGWPMTCFASGVNAEQADDLRAEFKKHGLDVEVTKDGDPIYRDAAHRKKALRARGFVDRLSFY